MALTQVKAAGLAADLIDETKLADDSIDSEHYNDGSIDHAHLAGDCVDGDNIADDSVDSEHYVDGSIDHAHLAADCVDGDNISDDSVGAEHIEVLDANLQLVDDAKIQIGTGNDLEIYHNATDNFIKNVNGSFKLLMGSEYAIHTKANGSVDLYYDDAKKLETVTGGVTVTGTATADTLVGRHGNAPTNTQGSTYTLVAADAGKVVKAAGNVTLDQNIFADGDILIIYNSTAGDITLIQGTSVTLRLAGDSATGTRTIAQKGVCTVLNVAANEAIAGGVGVS
jgi:hypothetical protein